VAGIGHGIGLDDVVNQSAGVVSPASSRRRIWRPRSDAASDRQAAALEGVDAHLLEASGESRASAPARVQLDAIGREFAHALGCRARRN
jgi:hypothetical protein